MPKTLGIFLIALVATGALAGHRPSIGRQPFPDDYTPSPCAPATCTSLPNKLEIAATGAPVRGYSLDPEWVQKHGDEVIALMAPTCAKLATCYATPGNDARFCADLTAPIFWSTCDRYPVGSEMYRHCSMFARLYAVHVDIAAKPKWKRAQDCAKRAESTGRKSLKISFLPEKIGPDYAGEFVVYASDAATKVPIKGLLSMDATTLRSRGLQGKPWTNYEIEWKPKFVRVPGANGHEELVAPKITVTAEGYKPVTLPMPMEPRKAIVELTPLPAKWKRGKNKITVHARDAETGKPVELRVLFGETILGNSNEPLELEIKGGQKRPEIWATSLFNLYDDIVVVPAEK